MFMQQFCGINVIAVSFACVLLNRALGDSTDAAHLHLQYCTLREIFIWKLSPAKNFRRSVILLQQIALPSSLRMASAISTPCLDRLDLVPSTGYSRSQLSSRSIASAGGLCCSSASHAWLSGLPLRDLSSTFPKAQAALLPFCWVRDAVWRVRVSVLISLPQVSISLRSATRLPRVRSHSLIPPRLSLCTFVQSVSHS